jgi:CheY-like chemotaxis protein
MKPIDPALLLNILNAQVLRSPGEPSRILIVDDEPEARALIDETLRSTGYLPVFASSAKQALEVLARSPISAVIADLLIPEMSGLDLILRIRQDPRLAVLPIIVLIPKDIDHHGDQTLSRQTNAIFLKTSPWEEMSLTKIHELVEEVIRDATRE